MRSLLTDPMPRVIGKLHHAIAASTHRYWTAQGGLSPLLPVTTGSVSSPMGRGSDSTSVQVLLDGVPTYLADSMQFHLELTVRVVDAPAYYLMSSFRGEKADATHLPQFFHSEAELDGDLAVVMAVAENYLRFLIADVLAHCGADLDEVGTGRAHLDRFLCSSRLPRITFDEAAALVPRHVEHHDGWRSLTRDGETALLEETGGAVWLTHFDHQAVPFYQAFADGDRRRAACADLLIGPGELIGAGERHTTAREVTEALAAHSVDLEPYRWYVEMKRLRPRRTAGFGMGIERLLMWVLGRDDIRDVQFIPRDTPHDLAL